MESEEAEQIRKRYLYRRLILTQGIRLSRVSAVKLVGPDCAYHLYAISPGPKTPDIEKSDHELNVRK